MSNDSKNLYILTFKNEPLIKVGLSIDAYMRSLALGFDRFDLKGTYRGSDEKAHRFSRGMNRTS
jgi:hypothetical protein